MLAGVTKAETVTGNGFIDVCQMNEPLEDNVACENYLIGLTTGMVYLSKLDDFCFPENFIMGQAAAIAWKYVKNNPKHLAEPIQSLVFDSLTEAFPCK